MTDIKADKVLDLKGLPCPLPVVKISQAINTVSVGQVIEAVTTDPGSLTDFPAWTISTGQELLKSEQSGEEIRFWIKRLK